MAGKWTYINSGGEEQEVFNYNRIGVSGGSLTLYFDNAGYGDASPAGTLTCSISSWSGFSGSVSLVEQRADSFKAKVVITASANNTTDDQKGTLTLYNDGKACGTYDVWSSCPRVFSFSQKTLTFPASGGTQTVTATCTPTTGSITWDSNGPVDGSVQQGFTDLVLVSRSNGIATFSVSCPSISIGAVSGRTCALVLKMTSFDTVTDTLTVTQAAPSPIIGFYPIGEGTAKSISLAKKTAPGSFRIYFKGNVGTVTATPSESWIDLGNGGGASKTLTFTDGLCEVNFSAEDNSGRARTGTITVRATGASQVLTVTLTQETFYEISIETGASPKANNTRSVSGKVTANAPWTLTSSSAWLTVSPTSGEAGETAIELTTTEHLSKYPRTATLTGTCEDAEGTSDFTQLGVPVIKVKRELRAGDVSATCDADWITIDGGIIRAAANETGASRTATVVFSGSVGGRGTLTVNQGSGG